MAIEVAPSTLSKTAMYKPSLGKGPLSHMAKSDGCFVKNVQARQLFYGYPASGNFKVNEVKEAMERAARENSVLVLYAHDITQQMQPKNHITIDQLTILLEHARKLGMAIRGMNEL